MSDGPDETTPSNRSPDAGSRSAGAAGGHQQGRPGPANVQGSAGADGRPDAQNAGQQHPQHPPHGPDGPGGSGPGQPPGGGTNRRGFLQYGAVAAALVGGWFVYDSVLAGPSVDRSTPEATVRSNLRGFEQESIEVVKQTMHPDSPAYDQTVQQASQMFSQYELEYSLTIRGTRTNGDRAEVDVTQTTRKISGPQFRDNRIEATHDVRTYQDHWRIYDTSVSDVEYL